MLTDDELREIYPQFDDEISKSQAYRDYAIDLLTTFSGLWYKRAIETGFENGVSACAILKCGEELGATLTSVDIRPNTKGHEYLACMEGYKSRHTFVADDSVRFWKRLGPPGTSMVDLVYVDADHTYQGHYNDMRMGWMRLNEGGHLVVDDVEHHANMTAEYGCAAATMRFVFEQQRSISKIRFSGRLFVIQKGVRNG